MIGQALGVEDGERFNWRYTIDLPVPAAGAETETLRVTFDDWMCLQSETRLFNRAYVSKYGVVIAEALISFRKLD